MKQLKQIFLVFALMMILSNVGWGQTTIFSENMGAGGSGIAITTYTGWQNNGVLVFTGSGDLRNTTSSTGYTGASGTGNIFLTNTVGKNFQIASIVTTNYTTLSLSFGAFKSTTASNMSELKLEYSTDGTNYTVISIPAQPTGSGTANWRLITISLPVGAEGASNLRLRWTNTSATPQFRLDDVKLVGTLASSNDANSYVSAPTTQINAADISSLTTSSSSPVSVFNFKISDLGSGDALATKVTGVKIYSTGTATLSTVLAGAQLFDGSTQITTGTPVITATDITFPITSGNLDVTNNSNKELTLKIYLNSSGITDNQTMVFQVNQTSHGFTSDASGSGFASDFGAAVIGNTMTVRVVATKLTYTTNKPPSSVAINTIFDVEVNARDANNNLDLDATNSITLSRNTGTGSLSSSTGLTQSLSGGIYSWTDIKYNTAETFSITATASSGLSPITSSDILCTEPVYAASDLFISEYIEGSSNNKYIEIYNGTGADVDLSNYTLRLYANGSSTVSNEYTMLGTLTNGNVIVYKNSLAAAYTGTATVSSAVNFNGDDAVALYNVSKGKNIDIFGVIGNDPGSAWTDGSYSTLDKTLIRNNGVVQGISNNPTGTGTTAFTTLTTEWSLLNIDDVSGLGSHTFVPIPAGNDIQTIASGNNSYTFTNTSVKINFMNVTSTGTIRIKKYNNEAANISGITETNKSTFKWLIINTGVVFGSTTEIRFKASEIYGIGNPALTTIILYKRETPGGGAFTSAGTLTYDEANGELYTTVSSFSEFVMASNDEPLPVQLSSFNSNYVGRNIKLNWATASENNNSGFNIERAEVRSQNLEFSKIGFISGHGTVNTPTNYSFEDKNLQTGKYKYRLKQIDHNGNYEYFELNGEVEIGVPKKYDLSQNYPNPFNPVTKINFDLPVDSKVTMLIYDITGREVAKLLNGEFKKAGYHTTNFNASSLSSGVYFYSLSTDAFRMTKKMVVVK